MKKTEPVYRFITGIKIPMLGMRYSTCYALMGKPSYVDSGYLLVYDGLEVEIEDRGILIHWPAVGHIQITSPEMRLFGEQIIGKSVDRVLKLLSDNNVTKLNRMDRPEHNETVLQVPCWCVEMTFEKDALLAFEIYQYRTMKGRPWASKFIPMDLGQQHPGGEAEISATHD